MESHNPPPSEPPSSLALVTFSNRCGTLQSTLLRGPASLLAHRLMSTPFESQPPRWHIARCVALIPFVTAQATANRYCPLWTFSFEFPLKVFKTRLRGFHTLIKNDSFSTPTDVGSHINIPRSSKESGFPHNSKPLKFYFS